MASACHQSDTVVKHWASPLAPETQKKPVSQDQLVTFRELWSGERAEETKATAMLASRRGDKVTWSSFQAINVTSSGCPGKVDLTAEWRWKVTPAMQNSELAQSRSRREAQQSTGGETTGGQAAVARSSHRKTSWEHYGIYSILSSKAVGGVGAISGLVIHGATQASVQPTYLACLASFRPSFDNVLACRRFSFHLGKPTAASVE
ncbi:hypothetical protein NQZ68_000666 [Dissostichus eleginoides]|nr:hypothetical protein NQZ68_000666 [Dissostichus eleginoides]